jgi:hypothetical protein
MSNGDRPPASLQFALAASHSSCSKQLALNTGGGNDRCRYFWRAQSLRFVQPSGAKSDQVELLKGNLFARNLCMQLGN